VGQVFPGRRGYHINNAYGPDGLTQQYDVRILQAFYPEFLQRFLLSSFNCFIVQSEYLFAILTANY